MSDLLERDLREALVDRAAHITPQASARLQAIDYHPRSRRLPSRPVLGALGLSGAAAAAGAALLLGSSAAPAFAGWTATPTAPLPGQLAAAQQHCGTGAGTPVLTDTRGPYTASIYANGSTCVDGDGIEVSASQRWRRDIKRPDRDDRAQRRRRVRLRWARADDGRRPDRRRRHGRDHHAQRRKHSSGDRQERPVPGVVARQRTRPDGPGGERERNPHAILPDWANAAKPGVPVGRPLRERLRLCHCAGA